MLQLKLTRFTNPDTTLFQGDEDQQYLCVTRSAHLFVSKIKLLENPDESLPRNCQMGCLYVDDVINKCCTPIDKLNEIYIIENIMSYINNWNEVPDGAQVVEDTYNQVYEIFTKEGGRYLRQVGWQVGNKPVPEYERLIDFEPQALYNQPWIRIG